MKNTLKIMSLIMAILMIAACMTACQGNGTKSTGASGTEDQNKAVAKVIDIPLSSEEYAFAVSKDDTALCEKVNEYLEKIKNDGTFDKICNNYFGDGTPTQVKSATEDKTKDQLVVATSTGFAPFEMVDENGVYSGIDLEIAAGLAEFLGKELVINDMKFESVITSVQKDICDIGMAGLTVTEARLAQVTFSNSYYNAAQVLIAKADDTKFDDCKTADDVVAILNQFDSNTMIGCQAGTTGEIYIDGDASDPDGYGFEGLPVTKKAFDYGALAVTAMKNGQINYVILDNAPANAIVKSVNGK